MATETAETPAAHTLQTVFELFAAVKREVAPVGKDSRNEQQNFKFRGIDAVVNAAAPALDRHGVITIPMLQDIAYNTVEVGKNRSVMGHVRVKVTYRFQGPAGDHFDAIVPGEAMDSGDKATAKAMSVAYRIALIQALNLPTGDPDPDTQTYERSASQAAAAAFGDDAAEPPRQQQRNNESRNDGPRPDPVAQALAKLTLQLASDTAKTVADLDERVGKQAAGKGKLDALVANPFGDGQVKLRDVLREARRRMQGDASAAESGPAGDAPADGEPASAAADLSDPETVFVTAYSATLAEATDEQLAAMRPEIGAAVKDRVISPQVAAELSAAYAARRRELAGAAA